MFLSEPEYSMGKWYENDGWHSLANIKSSTLLDKFYERFG